jgi:hypothetical protein
LLLEHFILVLLFQGSQAQNAAYLPSHYEKFAEYWPTFFPWIFLPHTEDLNWFGECFAKYETKRKGQPFRRNFAGFNDAERREILYRIIP